MPWNFILAPYWPELAHFQVQIKAEVVSLEENKKTEHFLKKKGGDEFSNLFMI